VIDTGMGIATEHLPHIFDPFFTTKEIGKGTGLGLAQVYGIIQQHGGMVTAQSEMGKGTSICLFLPALTGDAPLPEENEGQEAIGEGSETILLVEDNAPAREATKALLEMMGYRVFAAADGVAGLDLFHRYGDSIQLVLSDLVMPGMGGLELYGKIRSENSSVCMLIMTGYQLENDNQELTEHGLVEWLQKPFTIKQLTVAVRRVLEHAKRMGEEQEETREAKR
jgi:CheY-like chemotaxis protein